MHDPFPNASGVVVRCYRKFHACLLCLLKFFFSGLEDSEHILTPSALYVGLRAGSKARQFAQMMAIGRKKGVPNKTPALKDTILKAAECAVRISRIILGTDPMS